MKQKFTTVKSSSDVLTIQCFLRQRLAVQRIEKLKGIRLHNLIHMYSSMIQAVVRGRLARAFVRKILFFITAETKRRRRQSNMMLVNSLSGSSAKAFSSGVSSSSIQTSAYQGSSEDLNISKHQGKVKGSIAIVNYMTNPLQLAIQNKNVEAVKSLLDTTIITSDIATDLLITAIQSSEKSSMMLKDLLELGLRPYINDIHTKTGMTVLQTACLEGDLAGVQVILSLGCSVISLAFYFFCGYSPLLIPYWLVYVLHVEDR
jgi:hypothetical protein